MSEAKLAAKQILVIDEPLSDERILSVQDQIRKMGIKCHILRMNKEVTDWSISRGIMFCDLEKMQLVYKNKTYKGFTLLEMKILNTLIVKSGAYLTRDRIMEAIHDKDVSDRNIAIHIMRIRRKLNEIETNLAFIIKTANRLGYTFIPENIPK